LDSTPVTSRTDQWQRVRAFAASAISQYANDMALGIPEIICTGLTPGIGPGDFTSQPFPHGRTVGRVGRTIHGAIETASGVAMLISSGTIIWGRGAAATVASGPFAPLVAIGAISAKTAVVAAAS
jgi:hypothetical protein